MEGTTLGKLHLCNLRTTHLFCTLYWLIFFIVIDTYVVLWIFLLWLTYICLIEIDHCEEKLALWYIVKCNSIEWLLIDYFCLIIWYSTGSCLSCCYFCNDIRILFQSPIVIIFCINTPESLIVFQYSIATLINRSKVLLLCKQCHTS